ncbi:MAG: ABC transporter substrate-binding protein [Alphaproteobacteria bacterium]|nr:ABC transporter substrate-binding protein [Alphaproteobacteria bacterium]
MKSNLFLRVISVLISVFVWQEAYSAEISPIKAQEWAEEKGRLLIDTFQESNISLRYQKLDYLFNQYIDVPYIARFVVGKYWRQMSSEQQREYLQVFHRYALALYKTFPLDFVDNIKYRISGATPEGDFMIVNAVVSVNLSPNEPATDFLLSFRLHQVAEDIKLVDIKLAESSLLLSFRSKFYEMISALEGEMEWFIEDLTLMTQNAESHNQTKLSNI